MGDVCEDHIRITRQQTKPLCIRKYLRRMWRGHSKCFKLVGELFEELQWCENQKLCGSWWHVMLFCTIWLSRTRVMEQTKPKISKRLENKSKSQKMKMQSTYELSADASESRSSGARTATQWSCEAHVDPQWKLKSYVWVGHLKLILCLFSLSTFVIYLWHWCLWWTFMDMHVSKSSDLRYVAARYYIWEADRLRPGVRPDASADL